MSLKHRLDRVGQALRDQVERIPLFWLADHPDRLDLVPMFDSCPVGFPADRAADVERLGALGLAGDDLYWTGGLTRAQGWAMCVTIGRSLILEGNPRGPEFLAELFTINLDAPESECKKIAGWLAEQSPTWDADTAIRLTLTAIENDYWSLDQWQTALEHD